MYRLFPFVLDDLVCLVVLREIILTKINCFLFRIILPLCYETKRIHTIFNSNT